MPDKSQTYRVEGVEAELRHDLSCLPVLYRAAFSRRIEALRRAIKLFVFTWDRR